MQFNLIIAAFIATASSAAVLKARQDLTGLPDCAVTCFENNFVNTACAVTDVTCLCADTVFFTDVETCVLGGCDTADVLTTLSWAQAQCPNLA